MTSDHSSHQPSADLIETILEALQYSIATTLLQTDDLLFALASGTEEGQEVNLHLDTLRFLRNLRSPLPLETTTVLRALWANPTPDREQGASAGAPYALSAITGHIEALHHPLIDTIQRRLSSASAEARAGLPSDALEPRVIVQAITTALASYGASENINMLVIRLLDQLLSPALGEFYMEADQALAAHGLSTERSTSLHIDHEASGVMDKAALLDHLDQLQAASLSDTGSGQDLWIRGLPRLPDGATLPFSLKRPMELMGLMVYDALTNEGISPSFKTTLTHLHVPLIKAGLLDENVITRPQHPARQLWQELTELALLPDADTAPWRQTFDQLVTQLVKDFKRDLALFTTALDALAHLRDVSVINDVPSPIQDAPSPTKVSFEEASSIALDSIRNALASQRIPGSLRAFLMQAWGPLLMHLAQSEGLDSDAFAQARQLMVRLIQQTAIPLQPGQGNPVETLQSMKELLVSNHRMPQSMDCLLPALHEELEAAHKALTMPSSAEVKPTGSPTPMPEKSRVAPPSSATEPVLPIEPAPTGPKYHIPAIHIDNYLRLAVQAGDWYLVHAGPGLTARRLKVFHVDPLRGVVVFADRLDTPVLERIFTNFIDDVLDGVSRPVFEEERHIHALKRLRLQLDQGQKPHGSETS